MKSTDLSGAETEVVDIDDSEEAIPAEAEGMAASVLLAIVIFLVALAPWATRAQPSGKAWYLAPVNWPLLCLGIAAASGASMVWRFAKTLRAAPDIAVFRANAFWAFDRMGFAIEHGLYFCIYLLAVAWIGFTFASLLFMQFIVWRAGLRGIYWVLTTFAVAVAIALIFRVGIGLWFPLSPLLKLLPAWVGNNLGGFL